VAVQNLSFASPQVYQDPRRRRTSDSDTGLECEAAGVAMKRKPSTEVTAAWLRLMRLQSRVLDAVEQEDARV